MTTDPSTKRHFTCGVVKMAIVRHVDRFTLDRIGMCFSKRPIAIRCCDLLDPGVVYACSGWMLYASTNMILKSESSRLGRCDKYMKTARCPDVALKTTRFPTYRPLDRLNPTCEQRAPNDPTNSATAISSMTVLLNRACFSRVWMIQELCVYTHGHTRWQCRLLRRFQHHGTNHLTPEPNT